VIWGVGGARWFEDGRCWSSKANNVMKYITVEELAARVSVYEGIK